MNEFEKVKLLNELEPIISYNVNKYFNFRKNDYEDLMQEARMLVYENLDKYDETKASLSTFCQLLIRNNLVCKCRKEYRVWDKISFDDEIVALEPDNNDYTISYLYDKLKDCINHNRDKFTNKELELLDLFIDKRTFQEIENILNITANHRRQLLFYIKKKIINIIDKEL